MTCFRSIGRWLVMKLAHHGASEILIARSSWERKASLVPSLGPLLGPLLGVRVRGSTLRIARTSRPRTIRRRSCSVGDVPPTTSTFVECNARARLHILQRVHIGPSRCTPDVLSIATPCAGCHRRRAIGQRLRGDQLLNGADRLSIELGVDIAKYPRESS